MAVTVGVQIQPQHATFAEMRAAFIEAEALGADAIYIWDHFYPLYGDPDGKHFEALTTLAVLAEVTSRAEIGVLVTCNSYRNPELLADAHRTVDHISGGRAILGIGAGWFAKDYDEYGYEFGTAPERLKALGEALPRIKSRLAKLNPPPVRNPLPIMVGGAGPKVTLKLVAQYAQWWHSFGSPQVYAEKSAILADHCAKIGRDPSEIKRAWGMHTGLMDHVDELADAGVDQIILGVGGTEGGGGYNLSAVRELLSWRDAHNAR